MIDPNEIVTYNGVEMAIKDVPSATARNFWGMGHFPESGRGVLPRPDGKEWPFQPENCLLADEDRGIWINGNQHLVCPGCGMNYT